MTPMAVVSGLDRESLEFTIESIAEFAQRELPDKLLIELDDRDEFPEALVRRMCGEELESSSCSSPRSTAAWAGRRFDVYRVCERMAAIDVGIATSVLATFLGSDPILVGGTPEQRGCWLGRIAEEGVLFAYGATEPEAGSDLGALKTTASPSSRTARSSHTASTGASSGSERRRGRRGHCPRARAGRTDLVRRRHATRRLHHGDPENKHGIRLSNTAALFLDDVRVPADRLVGGVEGQGLVQAQQVFGYTRLMVAAFGLGAGWAALDRAIPYSTERIQGGAPAVGEAGLHPQADRAARRPPRSRARRHRGDRDPHRRRRRARCNTEGAIAKYLATEAGNAAADAAIQALGGYGYTHDYMVEKIKRDVRITTIYEGTSEIMEMTIARDRWQQHLKTRGRALPRRGRASSRRSARRSARTSRRWRSTRLAGCSRRAASPG